MAIIEPLNLRVFLVNVLSGSTEIFMFLTFIAIAYLSAYFRMNGFLMMAMYTVFLFIMYPYIDGVFAIMLLIFIALYFGVQIVRAIIR